MNDKKRFYENNSEFNVSLWYHRRANEKKIITNTLFPQRDLPTERYTKNYFFL